MKDQAESYAKSFNDGMEDIRIAAYLQGTTEMKKQVFKLLSKINYPESPSFREGFYERGFREGVLSVKRELNKL